MNSKILIFKLQIYKTIIDIIHFLKNIYSLIIIIPYDKHPFDVIILNFMTPNKYNV